MILSRRFLLSLITVGRGEKCPAERDSSFILVIVIVKIGEGRGEHGTWDPGHWATRLRKVRPQGQEIEKFNFYKAYGKGMISCQRSLVHLTFLSNRRGVKNAEFNSA